MKRKHSQSSSPEAESPDPPKRPRVTHLERGFSNLSLNNFAYGTNIAPDIPNSGVSPLASASTSSWPQPSFSATEMDIELSESFPPSHYTITQPDSVEEPTSPSATIPEIKMKGSSWYEPEPDREPSSSIRRDLPSHSNPSFPRRAGIVVTDLDSSDDEDGSDDQDGPLTISPALLQRIRERDMLKASLPTDSTQSQALILYRPPMIPAPPEDDELDALAPQVEIPPPQINVDDDDKMDVEPL
ncbi:hypothetical protein VNI00_012049 [Paramarasmius palmivorus]|uniref:Uncharacterized protein n=1 Tax=Paramarasmius palmivorus TaxID=297713 RepID=A0AAW0CAP6_9AGAR